MTNQEGPLAEQGIAPDVSEVLEQDPSDYFFFSSRRRHTRSLRDWSSDVCSSDLGVPFEKITLEQNDSDLVRFGNGTGGSRSITATGQAIVESSALVVEKGKQAAAHFMEASEGDIEFADGRFTIAGTDRSIGIMELSERLRDGKMPEGVPSSLDVDHATKET